MAQRITKRTVLGYLSTTFPNDLAKPQTATVEVYNYSELIAVQCESNQIVAFFAFDAEIPPDDTVQRTFYVVPDNGYVPDGNYKHCATLKPDAKPMRLHVFELVAS